LPWDHIDAGLKKAHLLSELEHALRSEPTPTCLERSCAECGGCETRFWKKPSAPFRNPDLPAAPPRLGEATVEMFRYRITYSKRAKARYISHIDLIHVLQRSFRRAGVEVRKTQGFHPKMDFSYGPALPLGMDGGREVLEFRSSFRLAEGPFLARTNRSLPSGIRVRSLELLKPGDPSLHEAIAGLVYSMDWQSEEFLEAWRESRGAGEGGAVMLPDRAWLKTHLADFRRRKPEAADVRITFKGRKLHLRLPPAPRKGLRVQDIVAEALGIPNPVFLLRRDSIVLRPGPRGN
jgi:hypothetical protein